MKVRRKKKSRFKRGEYPRKGTPGYEKLTAEEKRKSGLARLWKKGESGNPLGRRPGTGSVVTCLKRALSGPAYNKARYETLAEELSSVMTKKAKQGHAGFMAMILEKTESKMLTRDDIDALMERIYNLFIQHVTDDKTRAKLAVAMTAFKTTNEEDE